MGSTVFEPLLKQVTAKLLYVYGFDLHATKEVLSSGNLSQASQVAKNPETVYLLLNKLRPPPTAARGGEGEGSAGGDGGDNGGDHDETYRVAKLLYQPLESEADKNDGNDKTFELSTEVSFSFTLLVLSIITLER